MARLIPLGGRRAERAPHRARPGGGPRLPNSLGENLVGATPGWRARQASQRRRSYHVCMTGDTRCPLDKTVKTTSLAPDMKNT